MKWVDNLLDKIFKEPEIIQVTLKGKATKDPFEISLLNTGWQGGYDYAIENWTEGDGLKTFPEFMQKEHGFYWNGWAEGVFSGINKRLDMLYPGAKSLSYNRETNKYDVTYE